MENKVTMTITQRTLLIQVTYYKQYSVPKESCIRVVRVDNNILQTRPKQRSTFDIGSTSLS